VISTGAFAMLGSLKAAVTFGLIAMLAEPAMAQFPAGQGGMTFGVPIGLLDVPEIQKELKLDESQVQKSKDLIEATRQKSFRNVDQILKLPEAERRPKQLELQRAMNEESMKNAGAFLKPEQHKRLYQLEIQRRGFNAFYDPEIIKKLGFTEEQNGKFKTIVTEEQDVVRALQTAAAEGKAVMPRVSVLREATLARIVGILTDDQKKKWKEMNGEPFEFPPPNLGGR
jgi:hypothetical protein